MPKMGIAVFASDLGAHHKQAAILFLNYIFRHKRPGEAGPAGAGFKFVGGAEQRFSGNNVHVNAFLFVIPVVIVKRRFGTLFLGNLVL